jgi:uncharacterized LabA/DUF88 family protein
MIHSITTSKEAPGLTRSMALLIDGDNAQPSLIAKVLAETAKYGTITVRRIYGDWTTPQMSGWKNHLHTHAVQPVQQFRYTTGKNATDSTLIIDAMDLLHSGMVSGFCIVSSDSDYTRLATRIREQGLFVMGVGRAETPRSFVNACEVFVYTANLAAEGKPSQELDAPTEEGDWTRTVRTAIETASQDDGWALLAIVGTYLRQLDPAFDPRSFGQKQLSLLIKSRSDLFKTRESKRKDSRSGIYVKLAS